jgi:hypothetical protein
MKGGPIVITKEIPHSEYPDEMWLIYFEHKGASANIAIPKDRRDWAYLYDMLSTNRRKGEASELLREIDEYCQTHKMALIIRADVFDTGDDGIQSNEELAAWYEKNGAMYIEMDEEEGTPTLMLGYYRK